MYDPSFVFLLVKSLGLSGKSGVVGGQSWSSTSRPEQMGEDAPSAGNSPQNKSHQKPGDAKMNLDETHEAEGPDGGTSRGPIKEPEHQASLVGEIDENLSTNARGDWVRSLVLEIPCLRQLSP